MNNIFHPSQIKKRDDVTDCMVARYLKQNKCNLRHKMIIDAKVFINFVYRNNL
ncbi:hypothetical protein BN1221_02688 [Brenneria goodwinii]|uniref:Uncharacterized protein n=1 Tax=Brenneria goodwinii TaxID=1109412 RepID=A0A0G4JWC0_9GAMM|nr:hypothetical protein BN1221_02688 [Brenneria goodwinii]